LSWGGSASGALLADGYQADPEDAVIRARRYLMDGLMDGVIDRLMDGRAVDTEVSSLLAESSLEPHPRAAGEGGGVNGQDGSSGSRYLLRLVDAREESGPRGRPGERDRAAFQNRRGTQRCRDLLRLD
jgi:hypothetical protein